MLALEAPPTTPPSELKVTTRIRERWAQLRASAPGKQIVVLLLAQLATFWPVWHDWARRLWIGIDEPWGVLALATAIGVVARNLRSRPPTHQSTSTIDTAFLIFAALPVIAYALFGHRAPPLVGGLLATGALALTLSRIATGRAFNAALGGLLFLSLPASSALQFYLGYPIRSATAIVAAPLLRATGLAVTPSGTTLQFGGRSIWIDAPCSGVKMLWAGLFLALALAAIHRLSNGRTILAGALALLAVFVGNVVRSVALFYLEAGIIHAPPWAHPAAGVVAFAMTAVAIVWITARLSARSRSGAGASFAPTNPGRRLGRMAPGALPRRGRAVQKFGTGVICYSLVCLGAAVTPLLIPRATSAASNTAAFPGWPTQFDGLPLSPTPLAERERHFLTDFPGQVGKFSDGRRQFIFRWTPVATRKLHLSSDCFRGAGFEVTPLPALAAAGAAGEVQFSRFTATRGHETLTVSERIYDAAGASWPDVSSWYWAAVMGHTRGPWWGVTIVEGSEAAP